MKMMIRPVAKSILVKRIPEEKVCLIIVSTTKNKPFKVEVISMGKAVELDVAVGDTILITSGFQYNENDEEHLLVTEREVIGVVI
jgi:co-chaperonin GroES (HSP10)